MNRKVFLSVKSISGKALPFVFSGIVLIVALAIVLNAALASRNSYVTNQLHQPDTRSISSDSINPVSSIDQALEWSEYSNIRYAYSFRYPSNMYLYASKGVESRSVILTNYDELALTPSQLKDPLWPGKLKIEFTVLFEQKPETVDLINWIESRHSDLSNINLISEPQYSFIGEVNAVTHSLDIRSIESNGIINEWFVLLSDNDVLKISILSVSPVDQENLEFIVSSFMLTQELP